MPDVQKIPARHGVATFVPAGQTIKVINPSGTQRVDLWAFALPHPDGRKEDVVTDENKKPSPTNDIQQSPAQSGDAQQRSGNTNTAFPSQDDAEKATRETLARDWSSQANTSDKETNKSGLARYIPDSYMPSLSFAKQDSHNLSTTSETVPGPGEKTQQEKDSRTWASYFPSGKAFNSTGRTWSSYIPKQATDTVSQFAATHQRDPSKSYLAQLQDFSRTPVGAAGLAKVTGSSYGSSLYAAYSAYSNLTSGSAPIIEHLSLAHTLSHTGNLRIQVGDTLRTNLRQPIITLVEDTTAATSAEDYAHDMFSSACDPSFYRTIGTENWAQHGSCAENLVLALKELNERAGLKGARAVGAQVTVNNCPVPLGCFHGMTIENGKLLAASTNGHAKEMVRFRAERDIVIVLSACPQTIADRQPTDTHFVVEEKPEEPAAEALKRTIRKPVAAKKPVTMKRPIAAPSKKCSQADLSSTSAQGRETTEAMQPVSEQSPPVKTSNKQTVKTLSSNTPSISADDARAEVASSKPTKRIAKQTSPALTTVKKATYSSQPVGVKRNPIPIGPPPSRKTMQPNASLRAEQGESRVKFVSEHPTASRAARSSSLTNTMQHSDQGSGTEFPLNSGPAEKKKPRKLGARVKSAAAAQ